MNASNDEEVVWNPQMPDRRTADRRDPLPEDANGKTLRIRDPNTSFDRRASRGRRQSDKQVTVTLTGRAVDVKH
jgi:hypothetical protein